MTQTEAQIGRKQGVQQERQNTNTNKNTDITNHLYIDSPNCYFYWTLS